MEPEKSPSSPSRIAKRLRVFQHILSSWSSWLLTGVISSYQQLHSRYDQYKAKTAHKKQATNASRQDAQAGETGSRIYRKAVERIRKPSLPVRTVRFWFRRRKLVAGSKPNWVEKVTLFFTFGLLVTAAVQSYIYWQQSKTMQEQVGQTERAIILSKGQLQIAERNVKAAQDAVDLSRKQFQEDERPYVAVLSMGQCPFWRIAVGKSLFCAKVYFANFGKSPAIRMRMIGYIFTGTQAVDEGYAWLNEQRNKRPPDSAYGDVIPPGIPPGDRGDITPHLFVYSKEPVSDEQKPFLLSTDRAITVVARTEYADLSGNFHWGEVCWYWLTHDRNEFGPCPLHNEIH